MDNNTVYYEVRFENNNFNSFHTYDEAVKFSNDCTDRKNYIYKVTVHKELLVTVVPRSYKYG